MERVCLRFSKAKSMIKIGNGVVNIALENLSGISKWLGERRRDTINDHLPYRVIYAGT
jgi:hypothetical protein